MAVKPTVALNEASPAGDSYVALGDNRIREYKTQVREVMEVDHDFPSSGQTETAGQHKQVTLQESADIGSGDEGVPILGAQTYDGKPELTYTDEDDNDVQITKAGVLNFDAMKAAIFEYVFPIGRVITLGVSTNPNTLFGYGTWTAITGKVIVGIDGTQTEFDTLNETGGAKTHTLQVTEMPNHSHEVQGYGGGGGKLVGGASVASPTDKSSTYFTGGGQAHNNLQPYIVKFVWERVS